MSPCDLSTIVPISIANVLPHLKLINCYVDTIFVLPDFRTGQGMSTLSGNEEIITNFPQLTLSMGLNVEKT